MSLRTIDEGEAFAAAARAVGCAAPLPGEHRSKALIAALLRRAAWFTCPCPPRALVAPVSAALSRGGESAEAATEEVEEVLQALIDLGDLVEALEQVKAARRRMIYVAHPAVVPLSTGDALLLGIGPGGADSLPDPSLGRVEPLGLGRVLKAPAQEVLQALRSAGHIDVPYEHWIGKPTAAGATPEEHLHRYRHLLDAAPAAQDAAALSVLTRGDSTTTMNFKDRWAPLGSSTGRFVARRPVTFGADHWCLIQADRGEVVHLLDLPTPLAPKLRGCDEAWTLQAGIDAQSQHPQRFICAGRDLAVFGPLPGWIRRSWELLAEEVPPPAAPPRPLFAYRFTTDEQAAAQAALLSSALWMSPLHP